jgi:hypothetical protein
MSNTLDLEYAYSEMDHAIAQELPKLNELRELVKTLNVVELGYRPCYAIAPVATDGGENRLTFEPISIEIIRVVDSEGRERIQKIIPITSDPDIFKNYFKEIPILSRFLERLDIKYEDISYFLPQKKSEEETIDVRGAVRTFRDVIEWAVLLDMAWEPERSTVLLLRDGLLRSKSMKEPTVQALAKSFQEAYNEKGTLLAGVAKKARVLNYFSLAMTLENVFDRNYPCFCEIPEKIEEKSYHYVATWLGKRNFGDLYFAKLTETSDGLILPIEIPRWLKDRRKEILEYIADTAKVSFPVVGYPHQLIQAHENAVLSGIEMEVLATTLTRKVIDRIDETEREKILANIWFKRALSKGGGKNFD